MSSALHTIATTSWNEYVFTYSMGASYESQRRTPFGQNNNTIIAWYNNEMVHSSPIALNLLHMSIIQAIAGDQYSISVTNEPFAIRAQDEINDKELLRRAEATFEFLFPFVVYIIFSILSAKYTSFYIEVNEYGPDHLEISNHLTYHLGLLQERQCNAKFMQYVSGIRMPIFWGVSILWDMMTTSIIILIIIPMLLFSPHHHFKTAIELFGVCLIFFMYMFAMTPIVCIWSLVFTKPSFGRAFVSIFNIIVGTFGGKLAHRNRSSSSSIFALFTDE